MSVTHLPTAQATRFGKLPEVNAAQATALAQHIFDTIEPLRAGNGSDTLAAALLILAKGELRHAPGYGPRRGAVMLRLVASALESEAA